MNAQKTPLYILFSIILLPFLFFYWMIPFVSHLTIGSDYLEILHMQEEFLFSVRTGSFPLYVPGFGGGHSTSALTLGQLFYPVSYLASITPGYWEGNLVDVNNLFKLLSLGFAHLVLYAFLRKIRLNMLFSFILSLITVYNLRIPDLYRYGPALEAYFAHYFLCIAIGWYFVAPRKWLGPLCMIITTYMLVCSGHPQMMYYGFLGAAAFTLIAPFFLSTMLREKQPDGNALIKFWLVVGLCLILGILLSSAYILPFDFDFMKFSVERVERNYAWADRDLDTIFGTFNNFLLPLHSSVHGSFGGSSLILIALFMPLIRVFKVKIPRSVWSVWGLLIFMFVFMQGSRTPVHRLVWEYFPFASSMRVAGRISLIMPFFMMLLLAWVVTADKFTVRLRQSSISVSPLAALSCISISVLVIYSLFYIAGYNILPLMTFIEYFPDPMGWFYGLSFFWVVVIAIILGIISLIALALSNMSLGRARIFGTVLVVVTIAQVGIVLKYRTAQWIQETRDTPTFEEMREQKKISLNYRYYPGGGMHSSIVLTQINQSFLEPFLGKIFTHIVPVNNKETAYKMMQIERYPQQVFVEGFDADEAKIINDGAKDMKDGRVELEYSSFNRLQFHVSSEAPAFFGLSYPYTGHWSAWVNGERVHVYRCNGAAHAVEIPKGECRIEFRYWSDAYFWGFVVSCTTLALIGVFVCFGSLKGLQRTIGVVLILIISVGGFMLWYNSLYNGDNLETEFIWTYTPPLKTPNIAYGKKSWLSASAIPKPYPHTRNEARVSTLTDGDRSPGSGISSWLADNPAWFLDLFSNEKISNLLLYESGMDTSANIRRLSVSSPGPSEENLAFKDTVNRRPLTVSMSNDGSKWRTVASVISPAIHNEPLRIIFDKPETARFVKIELSGKSRLTFDEIEVYGPSE